MHYLTLRWYIALTNDLLRPAYTKTTLEPNQHAPSYIAELPEMEIYGKISSYDRPYTTR